MASAGSLDVTLSLQSQAFMNGMRQAAEETKKFQEEILETREHLGEMAEGLAAAFAYDWIKDKVEEALEYAEAIKKVGEVTGASSKFIQTFSFAAGQAGQSTQTANEALTRFAKSLGQAGNGNQQILKVFKDLGVTSKDTSTAVLQFADGLEKVPSQTQKVADVTAAFGKSAAGLLPVLEELAGNGFNNVSQEAEELGVVLSEQVINGSVQAEHKLTALKGVISADWANVIGQNAGALAQMATALISVAGAAATAASKVSVFMAEFAVDHPNLTKFVSGVLGQDYSKIQGSNLAEMLGSETGRADMSANNQAALRTLETLGKRGANGGTIGLTGADGRGFLQAGITDPIENTPEGRYAAQQKLFAERSKIVAAMRGGPAEAGEGGGGILPGLKPKKQPHQRDPNDIAAQYEKAIGAEKLQGYSLQEQLTDDPRERARLQHESIVYGVDQKDIEISDQLKAGKYGDKNSDLAKSRADELKKQNDLNGELQNAVVNRQLDNKLDEQDLALRQQAFDIQKEQLQNQLELARTAEERKKIQDKLIDIETAQQKDALETQLKEQQRSHDDAGATLTQNKINALAGQNADAHAANAKQNAGPLQDYANSINTTSAGMNEALENVEVNGLKNLSSGLLDAVTGTKSLGSAFKSMAKGIIADLAKIAIEDAIVAPLANALLGGGSGGGLGGLLGGLFGHRANGGLTAPGNYMVGERGPELVSIGSSANIATHAALTGMKTSGGGGGASITFAPGSVNSNDPAQMKAMAYQALTEAMPYILQNAKSAVKADLQRPRL